MRRAALLMLVAVAVTTGCKKHPDPDAPAAAASASAAPGSVAMSPETMRAAGVETAPVKLAGLTPRDDMPGTIEAPRDAVVVVNAKAAGIVRSIAVDEGDTVKENQHIASIWSRELAEAQADLARAHVATKHAREALSRTEGLEKEGLLSPRRLADDRLVWQQSQLAEQAAGERIRILGGSTGHKAGMIEIASPMAGTVSERSANRGEAVPENAPLVTVVDLSRLIVEVRAPIDVAVEPGSRVTFTAEGLGDRSFAATVRSVGPELDPQTRRVPVRCTLDAADKLLKPGMFVTAKVPRESVHGLVIPGSAVLEMDGGPVVFIAKDGRLLRRSVTLGPHADGRVLVMSGVAEHELVVVKGAFQVRSELEKSTLEE